MGGIRVKWYSGVGRGGASLDRESRRSTSVESERSKRVGLKGAVRTEGMWARALPGWRGWLEARGGRG